MEMQRVRIIAVEMVSPARCLDNPPKLKPTGFDMIMQRVPYQQRILFYQSPGTTSFEEILQLIKKSLADVLVVFYPLGGRLVPDESGGYVIDCGTGQSVKFVHAVTDSTVEELGEIQPCEFCDSLCDMAGTLPTYPWTLEDPLLLVQVTKFSCGGMSLGFAFNHNVVDGTSAWHFMTSWAEVARTGSVKNPPEISFSFKVPQLSPEQLAEKVKELPFTAAAASEILSNSPVKLVTKVYHLEPGMIQKLKADAAAATNGVRFSTFVVVGAYFWRKVTLARQLPSSEATGFMTLFNCRERVSSLSKWYFGNAATGLMTIMEAGEVESNWLSSCSTLQQNISAFCCESTMMDSVAYYVEVLCNPDEKKRLGVLWKNKVVHPIGSSRHPVYECNFGFGKPAGVTFGTSDLGDGKLYMFPSAKGDGGITATVVLPSEVMERLAQQED